MILSDQIQSLQNKLQLLLKQHHSIQKENQRLSKENLQLNEKLTTQNLTIQQLQQRVEALRMTSSGLTDDVKKDLDKRVTGYLKEIDKCLTLLNE